MNFLSAAAGSIGILPFPRMTMKSSFFSASSCRSSSSSSHGGRQNSFLSAPRSTRMAMKSTASSCRSSSSSSSHGGHNSNNLFLVRRFTPEDQIPYFSLISTENCETVCDFHSPHFYGGYVDCTSIKSVNGLMLLSNTPYDTYLTKEDEDEHICKEEEHLWNPSTDQFKLLPPSLCRNHRCSSTLFHTISFGFDSKSQDYKILRSVTNCFGDHYQQHLELYSLKNNSWKEILDYPTFFSQADKVYPTYNYLSAYYCYANGCGYWHTAYHQFISFDFATETFSFISIPETTIAEKCYEMVEFDGSLAVIVYTTELLVLEHNSFGLDHGELWVRNDDDGSWSMKFEIHVKDDVYMREPLWFSSDSQSLFLTGRSICGYWPIGCFRVVVYHLRTKEFKEFAFDDYSCSIQDGMAVYPYTHTKVALNEKIYNRI